MLKNGILIEDQTSFISLLTLGLPLSLLGRGVGITLTLAFKRSMFLLIPSKYSFSGISRKPWAAKGFHAIKKVWLTFWRHNTTRKVKYNRSFALARPFERRVIPYSQVPCPNKLFWFTKAMKFQKLIQPYRAFYTSNAPTTICWVQ